MHKKIHYIFILTILVVFSLLISCERKDSKKTSDLASGIDPDSFHVVTFDPEGILPEAIKFPSIYVQFSKPVVALQGLGATSAESPYMTIDPPIAGMYRWVGTSILTFESSESSIPQKEYHVTLADDLKSIDGDPLIGKNSFSFKTEELKLLSITPGYRAIAESRWIDPKDVPIKDAMEILLTFSWDVNPVVISKYITVKADNTPLEFSIAREGEKRLLLTLKQPPPENRDIIVKLEASARSEEGYLETEKFQSKKFHTITPFRLTDIEDDSQSYSKYTNPVYFKFSHQLSKDNLEKIVKGMGSVPEMSITEDNLEIRGNELVVYGLPVESGETYKLKIPKIIKDIYGRKLLSTDPIVTDIPVPLAGSFANFKDAGFKMLEAQFTPKLVFEHQNVLEGSRYTIEGITSDDTEKKSFSLGPDSVPKNIRVSEIIDLAPFLRENEQGLLTGSISFDARIKYRYRSYHGDGYNETTTTNNLTLQVTDLGLTVRYGYNKFLVLVTSLATGEPVEGADVELFNSSGGRKTLMPSGRKVVVSGKTDSDGLAVIPFEEGLYRKNFGSTSLYVRASKGEDSAVFRPNEYSLHWYGAIAVDSPSDSEDTSMQTFIFTDRGLYKPGDTMTFRGIDRNLQVAKYTPYEGEYTIQIKAVGKHEVLDTRTGTASYSGGFWGRWAIPETITPGRYSINYRRKLPNGRTFQKTEYFSVQFFERLRFEASISIPERAHISGDTLEASLQASYLGGGSLAESSYNSYWYRRPTYFNPTGDFLEGYRFGPSGDYRGKSRLSQDSGTLNAEGKVSLDIKTGYGRDKGLPHFYEIEVSVTDLGNQQISTSATKIVHPAQFYIGLSTPRNLKGFAKKGEPLKFDYLLLRGDSTLPLNSDLPRQKKITVELLREDWKAAQQRGISDQINTRYVNQLVREETKTINLVAGTELGKPAASFTVTPPKGGAYVLRLSTTDSKGRDIITERFFYVIGSDWYLYRGNQSQELSLTPDKDIYAIGETAQILLNSPIPKGRYLMTIEREGIFSEKVFEIEESTTLIDIPIKDDYVPIVYVTLSSYTTRTGEPTHDYTTSDLDKPKGIFGVTALYINTDSRRFDIEIIPDKLTYRPGETVSLTLQATKSEQPVSGAEITLMAVDRGVIDLINYRVPDPVNFFYAKYKFPNCIRGGESRTLLIDPVTYAVSNLFGGDAGSAEKIEVRKDFDPTAVFEPYLLTNENGTVTHTFTLPDNLTTYRITAVGVQEADFSLAESEIDVKNPISVRDVLPRRLREGDIAETGVVISNLDTVAHNVTIDLRLFEGAEHSGIAPRNDGLLRGIGLATVTGEKTKTIKVEPDTTVPLMFMVQADTFGFVTIEFTVKSDIINERILKPLEIDRPYIYGTVTTVGEIQADEEVATRNEKIIIPEQTDITVSLAPDLLGTLSDSVQYLFRYPYGCIEQRLSGILPLVVFSEYIEAFGLETEVENPKKVVETQLGTMAPHQNSNGGFPYWPGGTSPSLAPSMRFAEVIAKARIHKIAVPNRINIEELADYINKKTNDVYKNAPSSDTGNVSSQRSNAVFMRTYGLYTMQELNYLDKNDHLATVNTLAEDTGADIASLSLCGMIYTQWGEHAKAVKIEEKLSRYLRPTTRGVLVTPILEGGGSMWSFFNDKSEQYALLLQFYTELNRTNHNLAYSSMAGKLVYELLEQQKAGNGYWRSTATTTRVLIALDEYIIANELQATDFESNALLGAETLLTAKFKGLGNEPITRVVPFADLPAEDTFTFEIDGKGSLFYTISMKYMIPVDQQTYQDEGLNLFVDILDAQTGEIVSGETLIAGKVYRKRVTLSSARNRTFVALRVPIPAGAEVMNAAFVTTGSSEKYEESEKDSEYNNGLSSQAIYDSEVQYFWNNFRSGFQQVEFLFRAVRKGKYQTPAAQAECMYQPEVFGRYAGQIVTIE